MLPPPDAAAIARLTPVDVPVAGLFRLSKRPASEPYFARRAAYRFDDPAGAIGAATFGVLYAACDPETAFCESVIHSGNALYRAGAWQVAESELRSRHLVTYTRPGNPVLRLADLSGAGLKAVGLSNDISAGDDYTLPQQWAAAIFADREPWDGIRYVSRQNNTKLCYAVFDRSGAVRDSAAAMPQDLIDALCREFKVKPVTA